MSKSDKNLVVVGALAVSTVLAINWLEASPNCNRGCRTQLEHLKDHILGDTLPAAIPQFGPHIG
jgi:hypothetical protein